MTLYLKSLSNRIKHHSMGTQCLTQALAIILSSPATIRWSRAAQARVMSSHSDHRLETSIKIATKKPSYREVELNISTLSLSRSRRTARMPKRKRLRSLRDPQVSRDSIGAEKTRYSSLRIQKFQTIMSTKREFAPVGPTK